MGVASLELPKDTTQSLTRWPCPTPWGVYRPREGDRLTIWPRTTKRVQPWEVRGETGGAGGWNSQWSFLGSVASGGAGSQ